ncbi:MAG: alkaline phosphatase family protein [Acidimicrobiales bacterium]|nr:alkaline phosphatase family protein [Acidimicrobiales bacterium]
MRRPSRLKSIAMGGAAIAALTSAGALPGIAGATPASTTKHVLLISVDGLHASDLATCEANAAAGRPGGCSNLAGLAGYGTTYTNAITSKPSDSAPGTMALLTGGDPRLTGVYYDDSYDRTMYAPAAQTATGIQDCSGPAGAETQFAENVDTGAPTFSNPNGTRPIMNASLDPAQFPYAKVNGKCQPVSPNDFLRTNSVFSVASQAGLWTAWADKHPVYNQEVSGNGTPNSVSDPFNTEINADFVPSSVVDTRGNTVTFPLDNPDGTGPYFITDSVADTESYDQIKVDAILNEIDGWNSAHTKQAPVPAIFGMNFQTVSVGQKLVDPTVSCVRTPSNPACNQNYVPGGYEPGSTSDQPIFTPQMDGAVQSVDNAIGTMVNELRNQGVLGSTKIIVTAKHGQSPIDPSQLHKIGHAETKVLTNAGVDPALVTDDDIALVWLKNQSQTNQAVQALQADKAGSNTARIDYVLSGPQLAAQFNSPTQDPRTPDLIVQPIAGTIYSGSAGKVMEHGGFSMDDTHVAMLVIDGANLVKGNAVTSTVTSQVRTYQVAPTILSLLGLNPNKLDSVRIEGVKVLPGQ